MYLNVPTASCRTVIEVVQRDRTFLRLDVNIHGQASHQAEVHNFWLL